MRAIREKGGHFLEMKGQMYFDIGDKRAWDKTSQALREGQAEIRKRLEQEEARRKESKSSSQCDNSSKVAQYKQIISDHRFLDYSKRVLESVYNPRSSAAANLPTTKSTPGFHTPDAVQHACGPNCHHARRREALNKASADLFSVHQSKDGRKTSSVPHPLMASQQNIMAYPQQHKRHDLQPAYCSGSFASETPPIQSNQNYLQLSNSTARGIDSFPFNGTGWQTAELSNIGYFSSRNDNQRPYTKLQTSNVDANAESEASDLRENLDSFEPLPYDIENHHDNIPGSVYTIASVTSLRDMLFAIDFDPNPDEVRSSMDSLLSKEIDSLIRTQSDALKYIDAFKAFEDLVLDEENVIHGPSNPYSTEGEVSHLTDKDDISLMNMSFLTLDDKTKDGNDQIDGMKRASDDKSPRRIDPPNEINENISYRKPSCSNISIMSIDDMGSSRDSNDSNSNANEETLPEVIAMDAKKNEAIPQQEREEKMSVCPHNNTRV